VNFWPRNGFHTTRLLLQAMRFFAEANAHVHTYLRLRPQIVERFRNFTRVFNAQLLKARIN
jgi:hypothetical protein